MPPSERATDPTEGSDEMPVWVADLPAPVLTVARSGFEPDPGPPTPMDRHSWPSFVGVLHRHRLQGLLVHAVAHRNLATSIDQRVEVARLEAELTVFALWHDARLVETVGVLADAGIDARVLKGPALAHLDYPDRIMRPTGDIDLLIEGELLGTAATTLVGLGGRIVDPEPVAGYNRSIGKSTTVTMPDGLEIDLHRLLARGPFGVRMDPDDLWLASRPFEVAGTTLTTLGVEETLLHAALHLSVLSEPRALGIRDVAQVMANPALDARRVVELAECWKVDVVLAAAVRMAARTFRSLSDHPLVAWSSNHHPTRIESWYLRIATPGRVVGPAEWPATFLALPSARQRVLLLRSILRPRPGTSLPFGTRLRRWIRRDVWRGRRARAARRSVPVRETGRP